MQKGYQNKTEKEVNSQMRLTISIRVNLHRLLNFFKTQKEMKKVVTKNLGFYRGGYFQNLKKEVEKLV